MSENGFYSIKTEYGIPNMASSTDKMDIDMMDIEEPITEILTKFELQRKEIQDLKAKLKKMEDDYFEAAAERDSALERLRLYEPDDETEHE